MPAVRAKRPTHLPTLGGSFSLHRPASVHGVLRVDRLRTTALSSDRVTFFFSPVCSPKKSETTEQRPAFFSMRVFSYDAPKRRRGRSHPRIVSRVILATRTSSAASTGPSNGAPTGASAVASHVGTGSALAFPEAARWDVSRPLPRRRQRGKWLDGRHFGLPRRPKNVPDDDPIRGARLVASRDEPSLARGRRRARRLRSRITAAAHGRDGRGTQRDWPPDRDRNPERGAHGIGATARSGELREDQRPDACKVQVVRRRPAAVLRRSPAPSCIRAAARVDLRLQRLPRRRRLQREAQRKMRRLHERVRAARAGVRVPR